jgi:type IV pilus assembly protein PilA
MDTALTTWTARRRQHGFTFVELLVAMIVLGLLAAVMIPVFLGQREKAHGASAESLLRNGASAMEAAAVDTQSYALVTTADLAAAEPNTRWMTAPGASAADDEISVTGLGPQGYTLSTTSTSGTVYVLEKDLTGRPTVTRTCGAGCTW